MGSAFGLSNATQRNQIRVTQAGHGFAANDWLYRKADSTYGKAKADADSTADVCGVVYEVVDTDTFTMVLGGFIPDGFSSLTPGSRYFLSAATAGAMTATDPQIANNAYASKPVLIAVTATSGFVDIERSTKIGGTGLIIIDPMALMPSSVGAGTWTKAQNTSMLNNARYDSAGADGENFTYSGLNLLGGTYRLDAIITQYNNRGIVKFKIDNTVVATFDCYNSSLDHNKQYSQTDITIASGLHSLTLLIDGKNGSSSGYYCSFVLASLQRTGD